MASLKDEVRSFWYNNVPGSIHGVSRQEIQLYGGPSNKYDGCEMCQRSEWFSRIYQKNTFEEHKCGTSVECKGVCALQGKEEWVHRHHDFTFSLGIDQGLPAPKCLFLFPYAPEGEVHARFTSIGCDHWMLNLRRQLAQTCQVGIRGPRPTDCNEFDFALVFNHPRATDFTRPDIPIVMYGHDLRKDHGFIDHLRPDYLLTPCPTAWPQVNKFPEKTKVRFYCQSPSEYFTRTNLDIKHIDLLATGTIHGSTYRFRDALNTQLSALPSKYIVRCSNNLGMFSAHCSGETQTENWDGTIDTDISYHYLNAYSALLGSAKFVIFGHLAGEHQLVLAKHYECLGSGAIPIMPGSPDLHLLGVEPMVHYIPLEFVWEDNTQLEYYLSNYEDFRYIAFNAAGWHRENVDRMLFDDFENFVQEVTDHKYPRRLV